MRSVFAACLCVMSVSASAQVSPATVPVDPAAAMVVDVGRLFDGRAVIDDARLMIRDGRIVAAGKRAAVAVPPDTQTVDLGAVTVIPGLIAGHSHVGMADGVDGGGHNYTREIVTRDLRQFQRFGVVAVNALGMNGSLFHQLRTERAPAERADLYGAGGGIGATDGAPPASFNPPDALLRAQAPQEARDAVNRTADAGVDMIKIWVDDLDDRVPKMSPEVYAAAIAQAHVRGLKVAAHIHDLADAKAVARAGVDIIAHGVRDVAVDQEFIDLLLTRGIWYVATINVNEADYIYADHPEWLEEPFFRMALDPALEARLRDPKWRADALAKAAVPRRAVATNIDNLRRLHAAGVKIGFGTDAGSSPLRIPGFAEHLELANMVVAGMTPVEALTAATSSSAKMLSVPDRGCLWAGCRADFLLLRADPTENIAATRTITAIWRDGKPVNMPPERRRN